MQEVFLNVGAEYCNLNLNCSTAVLIYFLNRMCNTATCEISYFVITSGIIGL